ncbi:hypothetical protein HHI36_007019 [Cryptolaemus montrouzieri]|uniref:Protein kinase domain-containing protein n=1 Tax=Cryptolaemus montrouzieri TaxID=559131 RepID=A0ABD2MNJ1_9CUCU
MVVGEPSINNIMSGLENTGGVKQHNHRKKLKQRFDLIKKLGQGTFGKVQLGINKETGQEVAIKTIKKSKIESEADLVRIRREIQIMSSVQHPNIIHIYEVFENREKMVLVMEYAAGGELYDYLSERKVLTEDEARRIFRQIATACYYCHKHKICHRDLKLENILLDENNNAKIADFGLSNVFDDQRLLNTFCGSPLYASPEIVKGTPYHGPEVDCWSLGVLLYTLVYGAMPFDGSNFKRLVKQISQGDYFEPAKPSPASPLIREMLTVNPKHRADIEKICNHWWVNENYEENCLEISEDLANQTPVRLDLLLSLAPPPPQLESDKLVVTEDATEDAAKAEASAPTRSQSVGSLMELSHPAERRIREFLLEEKSPKRKLESTVSTDRVNLDKGLKRKEKIIKENTVADITVHGGLHEVASMDDASMSEAAPLNKSLTQTLSRDMEVEQIEDPSLEGAACKEIIEEVNKKAIKEPTRLKRNLTTTLSTKLENINETPSQESIVNSVNKENEEVETVAQEIKHENKEDKPEIKTAKKKVVKKKVLTDKNDNAKEKSKSPQPLEKNEKEEAKEEIQVNKENQEEIVEVPTKPVERRRSRIFEAAEKFQNMMSPSETPKTPIDKPKKIIIPGVSVDGFKKEFERKASLTSSSVPKLKSETPKKSLGVEKQKSVDSSPSTVVPPQPVEEKKVEQKKEAAEEKVIDDSKAVIKDDRKEQVRNAVSIISSALDKEGARKSKSRPCMMRKPPVPFGVSGRSASGNIGMISSNLMAPVAPKPFVRPQYDKIEPHQVEETPSEAPDDKISSAEITLKSATLPRRKTSKAEIQLNYPSPKPATMEFKTEMAHPVQAHPKLSTQRSEVIVPIGGHASVNFRASSLEPESVTKPRERIIPIAFEKIEPNRESPQSPPMKPPTPKVYQTQRSNISQRSGSLSRQSTQDSDTDTVTSTGEPIKKSPREYIIPIAIEGGGYVTPRAGSLEPTESTTNASIASSRVKSAFGKTKRFNSRLSDRDSEDESPFTNLHRHSSFGKDSDTEDSRRDTFHMHRLRSTRPKKASVEHADSISSGEDDDDDGFDILTAENLFSTLLSRVRDLTQRLNVEDGGRPGFPSSRLLSHFDHGTNFWNMHNRMDPFSRHTSLSNTFDRGNPRPYNTPWRRSVSRDLASDIDSVINEGNDPRGDKNSKKENLNLADLDLKKLNLSEEESMALSYLTPALTRRMQKQLLAQLAPSEVRKLHRTLSSRNSSDANSYESRRNASNSLNRRSVDRLSSTLPRKYSNDSTSKSHTNVDEKLLDLDRNREVEPEKVKSFLPVKSQIRTERRSPFRDHRIHDNDMTIRGLRATRSMSNREPRGYSGSRTDSNLIYSPDSSLSESIPSFAKDPDTISELSSREFSTDSYSSISRPSSFSKTDDVGFRYSRPNKSYESSQIVPNSSDSPKTDVRKPASTKRISRFLRPDFFDPPKPDNIVVKEKKEREMETQKVLKEIRDKRKERLSLRRERSVSKEKQLDSEFSNCESSERADNSRSATSSSFKESEANTQGVPEYVNVKNEGSIVDNKVLENSRKLPEYVNVSAETTKKSRISKLARPKSYPAESSIKQASRLPDKAKTPQEKESKMSKLKKGFVRKEPKEKNKDDKNEVNKSINEEEKVFKNKLLHSIEKKLEKFRSSPDKVKENSAVENTIRKLREQSLPKNLDHCTESGLIKRAVSVEDLSNNIQLTDKPLLASRKSVTKILGLFKKYEESDNKKNEKVVKKKKVKSKNESKTKSSDSDNQKEINSNSISETASDTSKTYLDEKEAEKTKYNLVDERKNDIGSRETKLRQSKLPVNAFRRSLNLDNVVNDPPKLSSKFEEKQDVEKPDKKCLRLDFSRIRGSKTEPGILENRASTSVEYSRTLDPKRNSFATQQEMSHYLSPDDMSCDSWSICSDAHSPLSPNGHVYSGDESESVIDRIRRKSFYTRFNEKKRPHPKNYMKSYRDLDLYKDLGLRAPNNYGSLDRRNYNYDKFDRLANHVPAVSQSKREYKPYVRSASVLSDYVNVPSQYQPYSSKMSFPSVSYSDVENNLDEDISTANSRRNSSLSKPSIFNRTSSKSPSLEGIHIESTASSMVSSPATSTKLH